jgi:hypothetical protein
LCGIGAVAVEKGFITTEQPCQAMTIQATENLKEGKHRRIGRILFDQGNITHAQIDEVIEAMKRNFPSLEKVHSGFACVELPEA